jgi:hypothetical protein
MGSITRDIAEIASLMVGVALVGLLVSQSAGTAKVIQASTAGFGNLLSILQLRQPSNSFGSY